MTNTPLIADAPVREMEWAMDPEAAVALGSPDAAREPLVEVNKQFGRNVDPPCQVLLDGSCDCDGDACSGK